MATHANGWAFVLLGHSDASDSDANSQHPGAPDLGPLQMLAALGLMLVTFFVSRYFDLKQDKGIAIATFRTVVQLYALGYILLPIFKNNETYVVLPWVLAMTLMAAREAWARPKYGYCGMFLHIWLATFVGLGLIMAFATVLVFQQHPWWDAKIVIPICGMLLGNTLNNVTLSMERLLTEASEEREKVELLLTRGATSYEAILPSIQRAVHVGITPSLNQMNVIGLVSLPGMMTGQILGGGLPLVAAKYQIMIMFLITGTGICTMICVLAMASYGLFDKRARLRPEHLKKRTAKQQDVVLWFVSLVTGTFEAIGRFLTNRPSPTAATAQTRTTTGATAEETRPLIMSSKVPKARWHLSPAPAAGVETGYLSVSGLSHSFNGQLLWMGITFTVRRAGMLVITGPNGCGKSTLLRALCDLQDVVGDIKLGGTHCRSVRPAEWRSRVMYMQQGNKLNITGTPRQFWEKVQALRVHRHKLGKKQDPFGLAERWGMPLALWDQEWGTLSGGQAQHLHLAMALASDAEVLLLDEPLNACDPAAVQRLEADLRRHEAMKIIITHDEDQADRLTSAGGQRLVFQWTAKDVP